MSTSSTALEAKLQAATASFTKLESDYAKAVEARQRLDAQKTENESVKKELAALTPNNNVFKLVGPILMKQEPDEAKQNVDKRLEWIGGEIKRVETNLKDLETKLETKKVEIVNLQGQYQQQLQASGAPPTAGAAAVAA
ncbi:prefoldin subunit 6 [Rhodotorula toruloides]|uniref:Prefoldin subunit 6 n=1 Tax=Rhodotorula toruloides TaxID=5286 RepID=A0A511K9H6_RHOTO|nr:prefoldin subunit 6 [Rhodotorula toruloides]